MESGIQLKESEIPQRIGIGNSSSTDKKSESFHGVISRGKKNRCFGCDDLKTTTDGFVTKENKFNDFTFVKYLNNRYPFK